MFSLPTGTAAAVSRQGSLVMLHLQADRELEGAAHSGSDRPAGPESAATERVLRAFPQARPDPDAAPLPALRRQLAEYFAGERRDFELPLDPQGTPFERRVWLQLLAIPFGETRSYAQVAAAIGRPAACRAVGRANGRNPIGVVIPCHRVIGSDGSLTGYGGGLAMKRLLLRLEGALGETLGLFPV